MESNRPDPSETLETLKGLDREATKGPWIPSKSSILTCQVITCKSGGFVSHTMTKKDGKVIAALHEDDTSFYLCDSGVTKKQARLNTRLITTLRNEAIPALDKAISQRDELRKALEQLVTAYRSGEFPKGEWYTEETGDAVVWLGDGRGYLPIWAKDERSTNPDDPYYPSVYNWAGQKALVVILNALAKLSESEEHPNA